MDQQGPGGPSGYGGPSRRVVTPAQNTQDQPEGSPGGSGGLNGHSAGGTTGDGGPVVAAFFFFFFLTREALQVKKPLITVYEENVEYGGK